MTTVLENFETWKDFLGKQVVKAREMGMTNEAISNLAFQIGQFLSDKVDPENEENRLLKQLWAVGNEDEKHTIARLMVKLAD